MNNLQLFLAIGLPTLSVLTGLAVSVIQIMGVRQDNRDLRSEMNAKFDRIDAKFERIDAKFDGVNAKIDLLTGKVYELMAR